MYKLLLFYTNVETQYANFSASDLKYSTLVAATSRTLAAET
jgi:hypothetical protein